MGVDGTAASRRAGVGFGSSSRRPRRMHMRRFLLAFAAVALILGIAAPAVLAASPGFERTDRVLMAFNGDVTVPDGQAADVVFVTNGTATIHGDVQSLFVIDGT